MHTLVAFLRHGSNAVLVLGTLVFGTLFAVGTLAAPPWAIPIGLSLFFISEYTTHRFLLHAPPAGSAFIRRLQHRLHYDHHTEPARLDLLFLPPWFLVPAIALVSALYATISHDLGVTMGLVLGNTIGLLYYEWVHYVAHIPFRPITPFGRYVKKYHLWHHFKNETLWFGVTNPIVDVVGRTYRNVEGAARSGRTHRLFP